MTKKQKLKHFSQLENSCYADEYILYAKSSNYIYINILEDTNEKLLGKYYSFTNHSDSLCKHYNYKDSIKCWGDKNENGIFSIVASDFIPTLKNQCSAFLTWKCDLDEPIDGLDKAIDDLLQQRMENTIILTPLREITDICRSSVFDVTYSVDEEVFKNILDSNFLVHYNF